jgi:hypothetical protein
LPASPEILLPGDRSARAGALSLAEIDRIEQRLSRLATTLDSAFVIPLTGIRFGMDAVLGLVPALGDLVGAGLSGYLILEARRLGAPPATLARMAGNVAVDTVFGSVPLLGSVFDIYYKANKRNIAILHEFLNELRSRHARVVAAPATREFPR